MQVAAELFDRKGYAETTMQDIADRLEVTKPTLYANVPSKRQILQEVIKHWMSSADEVLMKMEAEPDDRKKFRLLISGWLDVAVVNAEAFKVFLAEERDLPASFVQKYRRWSDQSYRRIVDVIVANQKNGVFHKSLDPTVTAFALIAFFNLLPRWYSDKGRLSVDQVGEAFAALIERGVLTRVSGKA